MFWQAECILCTSSLGPAHQSLLSSTRKAHVRPSIKHPTAMFQQVRESTRAFWNRREGKASRQRRHRRRRRRPASSTATSSSTSPEPGYSSRFAPSPYYYSPEPQFLLSILPSSSLVYPSFVQYTTPSRNKSFSWKERIESRLLRR